jgi:HSP20 family molecular chaperone IbpA
MTKETERIKVAPEVCSFVDENHTKLTIEIALPGVKKENIKLKMHEDSFNISAPREDNHTEYVSTLALCCPVKPGKADAKYENGLLRVEVPFKDPMEDAVAVKVA